MSLAPEITVPRPRVRARFEHLRTASLAVSLPRAALAVAFLVGLSLALRTQAIHAPLLDRRGALGRHRLAPVHATSRACCARTARRRCTTCCSASGSSVFGDGEARHARAVADLRAARPSRSALCAGRALFGAARRLDRRGARRADPVPDATTRRRRGCTRWSRCCRCRGAGFAARVRAPAPRGWLPAFGASLAADALHAQLGAVPRRRARSSRSAACWQRRAPTAARCCATRPRLRRRRRCSTCRGSRRCSTRRSTPARRGRTRRASASVLTRLTTCSAARRRRWRCCSRAGVGLARAAAPARARRAAPTRRAGARR